MESFKHFRTLKNGDRNYSKERVNYLNLYEEYIWKHHDHIHRLASQYANINTNG